MTEEAEGLSVEAKQVAAQEQTRSDKRRARRRRRLVESLAVIVVLIAVGLAVVFWPSPARTGPGAVGLKLDMTAAPAGPVEVTGADGLLIWSATPSQAVTMTVKNRTSHKVRARVWWTLAAPGEAQPWLHNAMQALPVAVDLDGSESRTVEVPVPPGDIEPGFYRLSLWAHTYDSAQKEWVHSDGRGMVGEVQVIAPGANLKHVAKASDLLWISGVTPADRWVAGTGANVQVSVVNAVADARVVQAWWYLAPEGTQDPWKSASAFRSEVVTSGVDGGSVTHLVLPAAELPRPGTYQLSVWLHQQDASGSKPVDGAFWSESVVVAER